MLPTPYFHVVFTLPHELTQVPMLARAALYVERRPLGPINRDTS